MFQFFKGLFMKLSRTAAIVALCAIAAMTAFSQKLPKIEFEKYTLANGLQVILHIDKKMPAVNVNLWYHVGSKNEKPGRTGFAHLFEHLMFQGSKNVKGEYLSLAEQAGANLRTGGVTGTTSQDRTNYFETVPTSSLEYALWLESDRMGFLVDAMTQEKLDNQRDVVKNEKRQGENQPYAKADELINENIFPKGHPYSWTVIGSMEDLSAASLEDVKEFFRTWYTPNNCTLTLSGDFDPATAKQLIQKYFGPIPAGPPLDRMKAYIPALAADKLEVAYDRVPQARLYLCYPSVPAYDQLEAPLDFSTFFLASGKNSRLYKKLVHDLELCSSVNVNNGCSEIAGMYIIEATARPGKSLDEIKRIIDEELKAFAAAGPTEEELRTQKAKQEMSFLSGLERIGGFGGKADRFGMYNTFLGNPDYFQQDYDRYQNVTGKEVVKAFTDWVLNAHRFELRILPEPSGRADGKEFNRTAIPSMEAAVTFHPPEVEKKTLSNGLEIYVARRPQLPKVTCRLLLKEGNLKESADKAGTGWMTGAMLANGTKKRTAERIQEEMEKLGSSFSTQGSKLGASLSLSALKRNLDPSFEILADVLLNPSFPADELERTRKQRLDAIAQQKNNPSAVASMLFPRLLAGVGHPMGIQSAGTEASIKSIAGADLRACYESYYHPNNAALLFAGDITMAEAQKLAEKYLGAWKKGNLPAFAPEPASPPAKTTIYLVDRQDAPQSQIWIGSTAPDRKTKDYLPIELMNAVLGGAFSSRLNLNLREDKGYTYGAFSFFSMNPWYGWWAASAGVQTKFTKESLVEFRKEIEGIAGARPVTAEEATVLKNNLTRGYVQNFESMDMAMGQIASLVSAGVPLDQIADYVPGIEKQSPADIMATAKKYVDFGKCVVLVVGDLGKIEKDIRALDWGEVVVVDAEGAKVR